MLFANQQYWLIGLIVFLILAWVVHGYLNRVPNLPPGPRSWPFIGSLPQFLYIGAKYSNNAQGMVEALAKQYGPVCYIQLPFGAKMVFISGYKAVAESLTSSPLGEDRPPFPELNPGHPDDPDNGMGVLMSSGETWKEHRRFSLTVLRGFGVGKRSFEDQVATECGHIIEEIESKDGKPMELTRLLCNAVSNIICAVVLGKRFEYNDPEFQHMLHLLDKTLDANLSEFVVDLCFLVMPKVAPYLLKVPFFPKDQIEANQQLRRKLLDIVNEHGDTTESDNMRDYIDVYLNEMQRKREQGVDTYLKDIELCAVVHDFFIAGTETTSTTLRWALLFMMKYPDVQNRVQEEIDSVVGRDRLPRLADKPDLPYTQAVIHEIQRFGGIVAFTVPRYANQNTDFLGFTIPKGSFINSDLHSTTRDASIWDEPDVFKPERFLDEEGRVVKPPHHIVFGAGKRVCLGEQLARMELFIFYTHLMHRFSFTSPVGMENVDTSPKPSASILAPRPYEVCSKAR